MTITIYGSNTRPYPAALKHYFRSAERNGQVWHDVAGGVEVDFAPYGNSLAYDREGSFGTVCPMANTIGNVPVPISAGAWHTFAANKAIMVMYSARYMLDPSNVFGAAPVSSGTAGSRFSLGDINNIGLPGGSKYADPAGLGLAGSEYHCAIGRNTADMWKKTSFPRDIDPGIMQEPDLVNYPPDMIGSTTMAWLRHIGWKFSYDGFYPYRASPPAQRVARDIINVMIYDPVGGTKSYIVYDTDTFTPIIEATSTANDGLVTAFQPNPCIRVANLAVYSAYYFEFADGLPSDHLAASKWMGQRAKLGERFVYPKWELLS